MPLAPTGVPEQATGTRARVRLRAASLQHDPPQLGQLVFTDVRKGALTFRGLAVAHQVRSANFLQSLAELLHGEC
eukprot:15480371-Alexandrium_andersonii.AAC.1